MKVKDIMSSEIVSLKAEDSIETAAQLMKQYDVGAIPVCDNNHVVGIVTDRDIVLRSVATAQNTKQQKISTIMTTDPTVIRPDMDVKNAASVMSHRQIRRLAVVENDTLVGMVSLADISVTPTLTHSAEKALSDISQPYGTPLG